MGLKFSDGFDQYGLTTDLSNLWSTVGSPWTWNATAGRNGGGAMQAATTGAGQLATPIATIAVASPNPIGVAFWLKVSAAPAAQGLLLDFRDNGVNSCGSIHVNTSGQLALYNQDGVTLVTT